MPHNPTASTPVKETLLSCLNIKHLGRFGIDHARGAAFWVYLGRVCVAIQLRRSRLPAVSLLTSKDGWKWVFLSPKKNV